MLLSRYHDDTLAQTSYMLACEKSRMAIVVDPNRDVDEYLRAAEQRRLTIAFVAETHIHADFVSGARDLVRRCGATLVLSDEGGDDWRYRYAEAGATRLVHHGDVLALGSVRLVVRHTPGHTPEHICFVAYDDGVSAQPVGMFSGDFIFVGDVGRPDLLERAAGSAGTMDALARRLITSIREMRDLPDHLQIWPGHGPGSACGKSLGAMPSTTLGYERLANWAFQIHDDDRFVADVLAGQPEPPRYFAVMKLVNRDGPTPARVGQQLPALDLGGLRRALDRDAVAVDVRSSAEFADGHIPGAVHLPLGGSFATWAGALLPYDRQLVLLANDPGQVARAKHALTLIGLDRIVGWAGRSVALEWQRDVGPLSTVRRVDVATLAAAPELTVFDVRRAAEWNAGHVPNAWHLYLGDLVALADSVPRDTPIAVHCHGGTRSSIAASLLQANGFTNVVDVVGGFGAWLAAGLPTERDATDAEPGPA